MTLEKPTNTDFIIATDVREHIVRINRYVEINYPHVLEYFNGKLFWGKTSDRLTFQYIGINVWTDKLWVGYVGEVITSLGFDWCAHYQGENDLSLGTRFISFHLKYMRQDT